MAETKVKAEATKKLEKIAKPESKTKRKIREIQEEVMEKTSTALAEGKQPKTSKYIKEAMLDRGYSESSARCLKITKTNTWDELLDAYLPDNVVLRKLAEHVVCDDKRVSLGAIQEANKLKNKYPAEKLKIDAYRDDMDRYTEVEFED